MKRSKTERKEGRGSIWRHFFSWLDRSKSVNWFKREEKAKERETRRKRERKNEINEGKKEVENR